MNMYHQRYMTDISQIRGKTPHNQSITYRGQQNITMKMNLHFKRCRRNSLLGLIPNFHIETQNQNNCYQGNQIKKTIFEC